LICTKSDANLINTSKAISSQTKWPTLYSYRTSLDGSLLKPTGLVQKSGATWHSCYIHQIRKLGDSQSGCAM